jgi:hypothetical protein
VAALHWNVHRLTDGEKAAEKPATKTGTRALHISFSHLSSRVRCPLASPLKKKKKPQVSFLESMRVLAANDYLRDIAVLVLSYGLTIEFTEIIWKAAVKKAFPATNDYLKFMVRPSASFFSPSFPSLPPPPPLPSSPAKLLPLPPPHLFHFFSPFYPFSSFLGSLQLDDGLRLVADDDHRV